MSVFRLIHTDGSHTDCNSWSEANDKAVTGDLLVEVWF